MRGLRCGATSVMIDASAYEFEKNVEITRGIVELAGHVGVPVEGELGHVGDNEGSAEGSYHMDDPSKFFTDISLAKDYADRTGVDALAVAVGNAHGDYKFPPKLDFDRISAISERTDIPLVLHGGSGLSDDDFRIAVQRGICKVNIFTDIDKAGKAGIEEGLAAGAKTMMGLIPYEISAMKRVVENKIKLFGSDGKA